MYNIILCRDIYYLQSSVVDSGFFSHRKPYASNQKRHLLIEETFFFFFRRAPLGEAFFFRACFIRIEVNVRTTNKLLLLSYEHSKRQKKKRIARDYNKRRRLRVF